MDFYNTINHARTHTRKHQTRSNPEISYKQVGFYFFIGIYGLLYSWQPQETYMQSAPATIRLKHAQCIKSKTETKKIQPPHTVHLALRTQWEAKINHKNPLISLNTYCVWGLCPSVSLLCTQTPSIKNSWLYRPEILVFVHVGVRDRSDPVIHVLPIRWFLSDHVCV